MLSEAEAAEVTAAARERGLLFMEAMKTRFVPLHPHVVDAVGALGLVARVHASLCNDALASYRTRDTYILGGGPGSGVLLDCGIYCASWLDELLPGEIAVECVDTAFYEGSDVYVDAHMTIGGVAAELECACDRARPRQLVVEGERGILTVDDLHRPQHAELRIAGEPTRVLDAPYEVDDFYGQITTSAPLCVRETSKAPWCPTPQPVVAPASSMPSALLVAPRRQAQRCRPPVTLTTPFTHYSLSQPPGWLFLHPAQSGKYD